MNYPNYYNYQGQQYGQPLNQQGNSLYQPLNQFSQQVNQSSQDERIWVQGEGAAQAYLVAPNSFVRLWDSLAPVFYEKRADQSGRPYMETYEYKRRGSQTPSQAVMEDAQKNDYADRFKAIEERIEAIEKGLKHE